MHRLRRRLLLRRTFAAIRVAVSLVHNQQQQQQQQPHGASSSADRTHHEMEGLVSALSSLQSQLEQKAKTLEQVVRSYSNHSSPVSSSHGSGSGGGDSPPVPAAAATEAAATTGRMMTARELQLYRQQLHRKMQEHAAIAPTPEAATPAIAAAMPAEVYYRAIVSRGKVFSSGVPKGRPLPDLDIEPVPFAFPAEPTAATATVTTTTTAGRASIVPPEYAAEDARWVSPRRPARPQRVPDTPATLYIAPPPAATGKAAAAAAKKKGKSSVTTGSSKAAGKRAPLQEMSSVNR